MKMAQLWLARLNLTFLTLILIALMTNYLRSKSDTVVGRVKSRSGKDKERAEMELWFQFTCIPATSAIERVGITRPKRGIRISSYSEKMNGRFAAIRLTTLILVELETDKDVIKQNQLSTWWGRDVLNFLVRARVMVLRKLVGIINVSGQQPTTVTIAAPTTWWISYLGRKNVDTLAWGLCRMIH